MRSTITCEHIRRVLMLISPRLLAAPLASTSFECPLLLEEHLRLSVQLFIGLFLTLSQLLHPRATAQQHIRGRKNHPRRGAFRRAGSLNVSMQMRERYHSSFSIPHSTKACDSSRPSRHPQAPQTQLALPVSRLSPHMSPGFRGSVEASADGEP